MSGNNYTLKQYTRAEDTGTEDEMVSSLMRSARNDPNRDPLADQDFHRTRVNDLTEDQINALMDSSWIAPRIVDRFAELATKNGFKVDVQTNQHIDKKTAKAIEKNINEWIEERELASKLERQVEVERETGDGIILPVTKERGPSSSRTFKHPIGERVVKIESFNVFGNRKIRGFQFNQNPLSPDYEEMDWIEVRKIDEDGTDTGMVQKVHPSRFTHLRSRRSRRDPEMGLSVFRRMVNVLKSLINAEWSVGQAIFSMVFKILKTDLSQMDSAQQHRTVNRMLEKHLNGLSLAMIDKEEEFEFAGSGAGAQGIQPVFEFLKDLLAGATNTPKSILFGQQQGEITGSEKDRQNYFDRIAGFQKTHLNSEARYLIDLGLHAREEIQVPQGVRQIPVPTPEVIEYSIEWEDIFELSEREEAEIDQIKEQTNVARSQWITNLADRAIIDPQQASELMEVQDEGAVTQAQELAQRLQEKWGIDLGA